MDDDDDEAAGRVGSVDWTVAEDGAARGSDEIKTLSSARDCLNGLWVTCKLDPRHFHPALTHLSCGVAVENVPDCELAMVS